MRHLQCQRDGESVLALAARLPKGADPDHGRQTQEPHYQIVRGRESGHGSSHESCPIPQGDHNALVGNRVTQIFMGKRGRQYTVIREEFRLEGKDGGHDRFAYRVSKDYGGS